MLAQTLASSRCLLRFSVGNEGVVYAIEALPCNQEILGRNIALNELSNIRVVPVALAIRTVSWNCFPPRMEISG